MNSKLVIVTDLGLLRAYREIHNPADRQPHLKLIAELKPQGAHEKLSERVTDQGGRFPRGNAVPTISGDLSAGESLSTEAEHSRRLINQLAGEINTLLADEDITTCALAVSAPIHKQLLASLEPKARAKIAQVLPSNLAKTEAHELLGHFAKAGA